MSMFNGQRAPFSQRSPFEGPSAGNQYEGFGGGAVGSVGGRNYGNTPWWMLPAGTQRNPSFMPVAQQPAPAAAPAMPPALQAPVGGGPQDFFAALAGLLSGNKMPGQGFSYAGRHGAGAPNAWARPQMKQISPEIMARISGQGPLQAPSRMIGMPWQPAGAGLYTGSVGIGEDLRPTEKDPTPWKDKSWQDPRGNPRARPTPAGTGEPTPSPTPPRGLEPFEPVKKPGPLTEPTQRRFGSNRNWNPINPRRKNYRGPTAEDFRSWIQKADQEAKAQGHTRVSTGVWHDPVSGKTYAA